MGETDPLWAVATAPQYKNGGWDPELFFQSGRDQVQKIVEHAKTLGGLPSGTALDFGCGVGRLSQALAEHFDEVIGVDVAPSMINEAASYNKQGDRVRYILNERPDLSVLPDESVDFVYTEITLMHMEPRYSLEYIREFLRVTRSNGMVVFHIPDPTPRQGLRDKLPRWLVYGGNRLRTLRQPMMEIYGVPPTEITKVVTDAGWAVVDRQSWVAGSDRTEFRYWCRQAD